MLVHETLYNSRDLLCLGIYLLFNAFKIKRYKKFLSLSFDSLMLCHCKLCAKVNSIFIVIIYCLVVEKAS